jgi:hypothetical protein
MFHTHKRQLREVFEMSMPTETNRALVRRFYQEVFTQGKITVADEICSAEGYDSMLAQPRSG